MNKDVEYAYKVMYGMQISQRKGINIMSICATFATSSIEVERVPILGGGEIYDDHDSVEMNPMKATYERKFNMLVYHNNVTNRVEL